MPAMRSWMVLCALLASAALAVPKKPTVVLSGPAPLTKWLSRELSARYTPKVATSAVSALPTAKQVRDVTAAPGAVALVLCQASGKFITLQVLSGHDGTPLDTVTVKATLKKLPRVMPKPALAALMFAIGSGKAPGKVAAPAAEPVVEEQPAPEPVKEVVAAPTPTPPAPAPAPRRKEKEEPKPTPVKEVVTEAPSEFSPSSLPAVRASVGFGGFNRSFSWAGNPSQTLGSANQPFSGDISVDAAWFPAAHFTSNFASNLGVFISGDFGVGMVSVIRATGSRFANSATRLRFGGLVRLPLDSRFSLVAHLGYSRHELTTSATAVNDGSTRPNIPDVLFNGFRAGLGFRWRIGGTVELDALAGFQVVAGKGELASQRFFPDATALAVDAGGGISVEVAEHLRLRAGVEWQRYFVTLNAAESSLFFAKTAGDQYVTAAASLQWVM